MFSFFFAFLLYSKISYYSIRNKSRNLVQIFVDFNQLKYKNAHFLNFDHKKREAKIIFPLIFASLFFENFILKFIDIL